MLLLNVFWTNIILINIIILLFVNQNLFCLNLNSTKFFDSLKKDIFYWIVFFIICFFTIFYIFYDVHNCIINYYFFNFPLGSPYRNVLLEPFYNRYYLLCFYKLLAIYVAFASKNLSLGYRLLVWFVLIFFIKLAYMESAFIVDAGLFFLVANPAIANLDYFSWKVYLDSLLAYSSGEDKKVPEKYIKPEYPQPAYDIKGVYSTFLHSIESKETLEKRHVSCRPWYDAAAACGLMEKTAGSRIFESVVKGSDFGVDAALHRKIGEGAKKNMTIWQNCMNFEPVLGLPGSLDPTEKQNSSKTSKIRGTLRGTLKSSKSFAQFGEETNWIEPSIFTKNVTALPAIKVPEIKILSNDFSVYDEKGKEVKVHHNTTLRLPTKKD